MTNRRMALTSPQARLVEEYRDWLAAERSLAASTISYYVRAAGLFLSECDGRQAVAK